MSFGDIGFLLAESHAIASPSFIAAKEGVFQANFNLIQLPNSKHEWYLAKNSFQSSMSNMAELVRNTWMNQSIFHTRFSKTTNK